MSNKSENIDTYNTLKSVAEHLKESDKKVQVIFAHNGVGKTRLSRAFKELATTSDSYKCLYFQTCYSCSDLATDKQLLH
jgi:hypothetical protein